MLLTLLAQNWSSSTRLYYVVYPSALADPSAVQIKAGHDATSAAATAAGSEAAPTATTTFTFSAAAVGLTPGTSYKVALVWSDGSANSNVSVSSAFSTTASSTITGSMAGIEVGADALSGTGKVIVKGPLIATEAGTDALASTGKVIVKGPLAATETGADALAAPGRVIVKGALAAAETGADAFAAGGVVVGTLQGTMAATEAQDTFAASSPRPLADDPLNRLNTGGGPIGSMGPFAIQRRRRRPAMLDAGQDPQSTTDPWSEQFREVVAAEDAEISEFLFALVSSGVLDGRV